MYALAAEEGRESGCNIWNAELEREKTGMSEGCCVPAVRLGGTKT